MHIYCNNQNSFLHNSVMDYKFDQEFSEKTDQVKYADCLTYIIIPFHDHYLLTDCRQPGADHVFR
jgi:hypothetical protein